MSVNEAIDYYSAKHSASANVVPLESRERNNKQGRIARLLEMRLEGKNALAYGKPGYVTVTFELKSATKGVMLGVGFDTLEGQRLLSLDSDTDGEAWDLEPGRYTVRLGVDYFPLQPGSYSISTAVFTGHNCLDGVNGAAIWEVHTSTADNLSDRGFGAVRLKPLTEIATSV